MLTGYRLREATLLFQTGDTAGARRMINGVVRKVPAYAEAHACLAAVDWAQASWEKEGKNEGALEGECGLLRICYPGWDVDGFGQGDTRAAPLGKLHRNIPSKRPCR